MITTKVQNILDLLGKQTYSPEWFKLTKSLGAEPVDTTCGIALVEHSFPAFGFSITENDGTYTEVHFFYERQNFESYEDEIIKEVELGISRQDVRNEIGDPCSEKIRARHRPMPETDSKDELRKWELAKEEPIAYIDTYKFDDYVFTLEFDAEDDYLSSVAVCRLADLPDERLMDAGLYEQAIKHWQDEVQKKKNDLVYIAHLNLAECYTKLGDIESAEAEYKNALETSKCMTGDDTPYGITRLKYARFLMHSQRGHDAVSQICQHFWEHTSSMDAKIIEFFADYARSLDVDECSLGSLCKEVGDRS